jgi:branched-chain amino acid transport system ATP-binding protein
MPILETRELTVRFGGHIAVNAVTCGFEPGTLTAIVGPNGAGKTTYFNLISGQIPATSGDVIFKGENLTPLGPDKRTKRGIGRAFQLTNLFPNLPVLENVRLAVQARSRNGVDLFSMASRHRDLTDKAYTYLEQTALTQRARTKAAELSHGDQRKLEVALMLALEPDIFMFDEPTAGMSTGEVPVILDLIEDIKRSGDKTILLVEHKMDVVRRLADRIVVLVNGTLVADGDPAEVVALPVVQEAYLGIRRQPASC